MIYQTNLSKSYAFHAGKYANKSMIFSNQSSKRSFNSTPSNNNHRKLDYVLLLVI